jgi:hypothetical protein
MASVYAGTATAPGSLTIPDDGDNATAASVNTPIEALQDSVLWATRNAIIDTKLIADGTIDFSPENWDNVVADDAWHVLTDGVTTSMQVTITENLAIGDIIEIHAHVQVTTDAGGGALRIVVNYNSVDHVVEGSGIYCPGSATSLCQSWTCRHVMADAETGNIVVSIEGASPTNATSTLHIENTGLSLSTTVIRPG